MNLKIDKNHLRLAAQYWIPAIGTLLFTLGSIWDWTWTGNAVGSIMAFDTFLGVLLGYQTRRSAPGAMPGGFDGQIVLNTSDPVKDVYTLDLGDTLADLENRKSVTLTVVKPPASQE
jgi:hypothetical protein